MIGACGIGAFINLATTIPAILLWLEAGLLYDWQTYYIDNLDLLAGILGYGLVLTVTLSLMVVAMPDLAFLSKGSSRILMLLRMAGVVASRAGGSVWLRMR